MNILILGKGFLGQKVYNYLRLAQLSDSGNVDIFSKSELNYTDRLTLADHLSQHDYDFILNASGYTGVPNIDAAEYDKEICWKMNVEVPVTIVSAACHSKATVIHISSGCIFNGYVKHWEETDTPNFGVFNPGSSFYSKTKHAAETMIKNDAAILRIRMPFTGDISPRNYFTKLLQYDNLISTPNSVTCVEDLCDAILKICAHDNPIGVYHLVNEGALTAKQVIECLAKYELTNPNHRFIDRSELKTKAPRSNCILSTKITSEKIGPLPNVLESLEKCVKQYAALIQ